LAALQEKKVRPDFIPKLDETGLNHFSSNFTKQRPEESMVPI